MHRNTFRILFLLSLLLLVTGCGLGNNIVTNTASPASSTQSTGTGTRSPVITEFALPTQGGIPYQITAGPDGNLWFTEIVGNRIGRISSTGAISEYPLPTAGSLPADIALVKNTSEGIATIAMGFDWRAGDKIVVTWTDTKGDKRTDEATIA